MAPTCRFCAAPLTQTFLDLGSQPLANSYLTAEALAAGTERSYPLHVRVCGRCFLVQVAEPVPADAIFTADYAYFSSYSDSWVAHARRFAEAMIPRLGLGPGSLVIEVASNDGYLLQHFHRRGIPVLGIEPASNCAAAAAAKGIASEVAFFDRDSAARLAARGLGADLMVANNVLAHVPDLRGFVGGFPLLLKPQGTLVFEFPHLQRLIEGVQFDTIYHEHFSYLSLRVVEAVLATAGMRAYDVAELPTHGGSLRLFCCRGDAGHAETEALRDLRRREQAAGVADPAAYRGFTERAAAARRSFRAFLADAAAANRRVAAYGAAAKGNTFLNYCAVRPPEIACVFDRSLQKQGRFLPGSHLPVLAPERLGDVGPDYLVILPWNLQDEIMRQLPEHRAAGGQFVIAIPETRVLP